MEKRIYIPLPTPEGRRQLLTIAMRDVAVADDVDVEALARKSEGYSGADIANVCRDAAMMSMRRVLADARAKGMGVVEIKKAVQENSDLGTAVSHADFLEALAKVSKTVSASDLRRYQEWKDEYGAA